MKKNILIIITLCILMIPGCSNVRHDKKDETKEINEVAEKVAEIQDEENIQLEEPEIPDITSEDLKILEKNVKLVTQYTSFEDAIFEFEFYQGEENLGLEISVIKSMTEVMKHFNVSNTDDLIKCLKNSLVFNAFLDLVNENGLSQEFSVLKISFEDTKDDIYSLKYIINE